MQPLDRCVKGYLCPKHVVLWRRIHGSISICTTILLYVRQLCTLHRHMYILCRTPSVQYVAFCCVLLLPLNDTHTVHVRSSQDTTDTHTYIISVSLQAATPVFSHCCLLLPCTEGRLLPPSPPSPVGTPVRTTQLVYYVKDGKEVSI